MSRLTRRVRSDVSPMILKLLNLEEVPTECIEVIGTDSKTCDEVCRENQCGSCVLSAVFEKLAHYEDLEDEGRLIELPCKLKNAIDVIFSHNEIVTLMCDGVDENGTRCCLHFWHGMAWNIPKEYLELPFVKIHGVVSDKPDTLYVEVDAKFTPEEAEAKLKEMEGVE